MSIFKNPLDPENIQITQKVIEWTRHKYNIPTTVEVQVIERGCEDSSCLCVQTHIFWHDSIHNSKVIGKPLTFIRQWDF